MILFGEAQLALVNFVDILSVDDLHRCNPLITGRTMNIGPSIGEVVYKYAGIVFGDAVAMNFQQSSSRSLFVFQQLKTAPAINCQDLILGQFLQKNVPAVI